MSFVVILIALCLQHIFKLYSAPYQFNWESNYFQWLQKRMSVLTTGHGLFGVFLFVVPVLIVLSLVFSFAYHWFTVIGYLVLSLALLWYSLNTQCLQHDLNIPTDELWSASFQNCFAILFWYFIFGPVGLALYILVKGLHACLQEQKTVYPELLKYAGLTLAVLDWVPVRLLGLSFALVGHFGAVFKTWLPALGQGLVTDQQLVKLWGQAALSKEEDGAQSQSASVITLLTRSLYVWLVAMALVSLGLWFG